MARCAETNSSTPPPRLESGPEIPGEARERWGKADRAGPSGPVFLLASARRSCCGDLLPADPYLRMWDRRSYRLNEESARGRGRGGEEQGDVRAAVGGGD